MLHTPPGQYIGWAESGRKRGGSARLARAPADLTSPASAEMAELSFARRRKAWGHPSRNDPGHTQGQYRSDWRRYQYGRRTRACRATRRARSSAGGAQAHPGGHRFYPGARARASNLGSAGNRLRRTLKRRKVQRNQYALPAEAARFYQQNPRSNAADQLFFAWRRRSHCRAFSRSARLRLCARSRCRESALGAIAEPLLADTQSVTRTDSADGCASSLYRARYANDRMVHPHWKPHSYPVDQGR